MLTARIARRAWLVVVLGLAIAAAAGAAPVRKKPYRLPSVDLKQRVIWGATCDGPDGTGLAFGGQDQEADDGRPHTRVREAGGWKAIHEALRAANPLQPYRDRVGAVRTLQKDALARARAVYFKGLPEAERRRRGQIDLGPAQDEVVRQLDALLEAVRTIRNLDAQPSVQQGWAYARMEAARRAAAPLAGQLRQDVAAETLAGMLAVQRLLETAAEALDAEPPARALSPIVYEPRTGLYVVFGGDHCDYLTNDTWVFDPKARRWTQRHPPGAPPPRANHTLRAAGDGKVVLSGGYVYAFNTDYMGGQYVDLDDGEWTYDVAANTWTGPAAGAPPDTRVYRTGPFDPGFYLAGPAPDAAAHERVLADLPVNRWVLLDPPHAPALNRDWGTVRIDAHRDQILVWSGGHCAHGGSDVLHYHLATNRWELPHAVEFPLGQLYGNTEYPAGFNFNRRPWVTGHTYQDYEVDPVSRQMLFTGQRRYYYVYDPDVADWTARAPKPPGMIYGGCFYDLTLVATPQGIVCWGKGPKVHRFDGATRAWAEVAVEGNLPDPAVDYSTLVYDAKRGRLLLFRTGYGKPYDGQVHALDLGDRTVRPLTPTNMAAAAGRAFTIDRACYDPASDLVLFCALLPAGGDGVQRQPAYDCGRNRWVSLNIRYEAGANGKPVAPTATRRSVGLVYDARRGLVWGVDTNRLRVYVLRFDGRSAEAAPLE